MDLLRAWDKGQQLCPGCPPEDRELLLTPVDSVLVSCLGRRRLRTGGLRTGGSRTGWPRTGRLRTGRGGPQRPSAPPPQENQTSQETPHHHHRLTCCPLEDASGPQSPPPPQDCPTPPEGPSKPDPGAGLHLRLLTTRSKVSSLKGRNSSSAWTQWAGTRLSLLRLWTNSRR